MNNNEYDILCEIWMECECIKHDYLWDKELVTEENIRWPKWFWRKMKNVNYIGKDD